MVSEDEGRKRGKQNQEFDEPQSEKKKNKSQGIRWHTSDTQPPPDVLYNECFNECPACF